MISGPVWRRDRGPRDAGASSVRRIAVALAAMAGVTVFGTVGYVILGFSFLEALYQTIVTISTVGYREVNRLDGDGQVFTIAVILLGVGTTLYTFSVVLEALIGGHLRQHLGRRRMDAKINALRGHVIICGYGRVGAAAEEFLRAGGNDLVVIEADPERLKRLELHDPPTLHLQGDVTDDAVLREAGIEHARAVVIALDTDADTVYATLSARGMRPDLVIVSRARSNESKRKLELAGATRAVNPQRIGGRRLAAFALQPEVAEFLDAVTHDKDLDWQIQQVPILEGSQLAGRSVAEMGIVERTGALLLAVRRAPDQPLEPNPPGDLVIPAGSMMIALGTPSEIDALATLGSGTARPLE